jgi:hypothetical protein
MGRSPKVVDVAIKMDFYDALKEVMKGNKVTKLEWNNSDYVFLNGGKLRIMLNSVLFDLILTDGDMSGTDWIIKNE